MRSLHCKRGRASRLLALNQRVYFLYFSDVQGLVDVKRRLRY